MLNKNEEKILQQLRKRVLEKDEELSQKEYLSATKEALVEMTKLSEKEVNDIYIQIKKEEAEKRKKRNKVILYVSITLIVLIYLNYSRIIDAFRKPEIYRDDFSKNEGSWSFINQMLSSSYPENGLFIIDAHEKDNDVSYISKDAVFSTNYSLEVEASKFSGVKDNYGLYLNQSDGNFMYFFINKNGKFKVGGAVNGSWLKNPVNKESSAIERTDHKKNLLKVEVTAGNFKFFINGTLVHEGFMNKIVPKSFSLAVCNTQKIAFDNLFLKNSDTKTIIYQTNFDQVEYPWTNFKEVLRNSEYKNGAYHLTANKDNYCFWAWNWIPENFRNIKKYEITVDAYVQNIDNEYNFGIMFIKDDKNYWTFNVESEFGAKFMTYLNSEYKKTGNYNSNVVDKSGKYRLKLLVDKEKINFYVNGSFVDKIDKRKNYLYWSEIEKFGLRVCNHNTVAFDNFQMKEIK